MRNGGGKRWADLARKFKAEELDGKVVLMESVTAIVTEACSLSRRVRV